MKKKEIGIWATVVALIGGGGGWASYDRLKAHAIDVGNDNWVTLQSQNIDTRFRIEDELHKIERKIKKGLDDEDDRVRKAVLEERLRQLEKHK